MTTDALFDFVTKVHLVDKGFATPWQRYVPGRITYWISGVKVSKTEYLRRLRVAEKEGQ